MRRARKTLYFLQKVLLASESELILDEGVADWHGRAVVLPAVEKKKTMATVFCLMRTGIWADLRLGGLLVLGCPRAARPGKVNPLSSPFLFLFSVYFFCF
jgi:hypothetical protein